MDHNHLAELRELEANYWWHVNKRLVVLGLLERAVGVPGDVLEIGCGGGLLSSCLADRGWKVVAADVLADAVRFAATGGLPRGVVFDAGGPWPLADNSFDALLMLDVVEHIKNDSVALGEAMRVLRPGGVAVITVPAYPLLFSQWDEVLGHHRRYTRSTLSRLVCGAGFDVVKISFWNVVSLLPALYFRGKDRLLRRDKRPAEFPRVPRWLNGLLKQWGRLEWSLCRRCNLPFGLSLITVLRKPVRHYDSDTDTDSDSDSHTDTDTEAERVRLECQTSR